MQNIKLMSFEKLVGNTKFNDSVTKSPRTFADIIYKRISMVQESLGRVMETPLKEISEPISALVQVFSAMDQIKGLNINEQQNALFKGTNAQSDRDKFNAYLKGTKDAYEHFKEDVTRLAVGCEASEEFCKGDSKVFDKKTQALVKDLRSLLLDESKNGGRVAMALITMHENMVAWTKVDTTSTKASGNGPLYSAAEILDWLESNTRIGKLETDLKAAKIKLEDFIKVLD